MPADKEGDYDLLKEGLLKRYEMNAEDYQKTFQRLKPEISETAS